ncbi:MAG: amidohydrolase [Rhodospirillaceae bacterium]|nr:amidohydrolase [Rhodospirillaceae bacterium]
MAPKRLEIIDSHHHFWDLDQNCYPWLQNDNEPNFFLGDYESLKRNYLPEHYKDDSNGFDIVATVHVEAEWDRNDQVGETAWLHELNQKFKIPNAIVGHVWLGAQNCEEILLKHKEYSLFKGIRSKPTTSANPVDEKPTGIGSMHDTNWLYGLSLVEQLGLTYDLRVPYWHLYEAADVIARLPRLPIVLNHTGFPWDRSPEGLADWRSSIKTISDCPNVFIKLSELGLKDEPWTVDSNRGVVLDAIETFGVDRCMWASNFPVAGLRISYKEQLEGMLEIMSNFPAEDIQKIFKDNAANFYNIQLPVNSN